MSLFKKKKKNDGRKRHQSHTERGRVQHHTKEEGDSSTIHKEEGRNQRHPKDGEEGRPSQKDGRNTAQRTRREKGQDRICVLVVALVCNKNKIKGESADLSFHFHFHILTVTVTISLSLSLSMALLHFIKHLFLHLQFHFRTMYYYYIYRRGGGRKGLGFSVLELRPGAAVATGQARAATDPPNFFLISLLLETLLLRVLTVVS